MSLETEVRTKVLADSTVSGLISTRMYGVRAPQQPTYPLVTYQRVGGPRLDHLSGAASFGNATLQLDIYAATYLAALNLAAAIRSVLHGFNGTLTTLRVAISLDNELDGIEDDVTELGVYRIIQEYGILHSE